MKCYEVYINCEKLFLLKYLIIFFYSEFLKNLDQIKNSLMIDDQLQRAIVFLMTPEHLPLALEYGFKKRLVIRKMIGDVENGVYKLLVFKIISGSESIAGIIYCR